MKIIQLTVDLAFEDLHDARQLHDVVADRITEVCIEGLDAEVCDVRLVSSRMLPEPDFSGADDSHTDEVNERIEAWQAKARQDFARYRQVQR